MNQPKDPVIPPAVRTNGLLSDQWCRVGEDRMSLTFRADTPYEVWAVQMTHLLEIARGIQWMVGDGLAFGETAYPEQESQLFDPYHYSYESVERMTRTCRAIPPARRRKTVSFDIHQLVMGLPEEEQEALLDHAEKGATSAEIHRLVRQVRQRIVREQAALLPAPQLDIEGIEIAVGNALALPLHDEVVDLIITSPPYGLNKPYGVAAPDIEAYDWPVFMFEWLEEARRVTKPHGRLALNIPLDTSEPEFRPTYAQAVTAALDAGWEYRSTIVWLEGNTTKGGWALGSQDSAARPHHISQVEMIALFSNGDWAPSSSGKDDITPDDFQLAGRGPWVFPGESHPWEGHPAAFPLELPRRLIPYLSRVGDIILDPFSGSYTTAVAAYLAGRRCYGYDLDPACVASGQRRLAPVSRQG